jgi:hypothetical protein
MSLGLHKTRLVLVQTLQNAPHLAIVKIFAMKGNKILKVLDIPVIALATALTLIIAVTVHGRQTASSRVIVRGPDKTWVFPLEAEELVSVVGYIGETVVEISGGRTAIVSSPCGGQTCVAAGTLHKNGQWAACLPNKVFLLIEGTPAQDDVDAASW